MSDLEVIPNQNEKLGFKDKSTKNMKKGLIIRAASFLGAIYVIILYIGLSYNWNGQSYYR